MASHATASSVTRTGVGGNNQVNMGFVPEIWSGRTLKALDDKSYMLSKVNRDYEGEIKGQGDTVRIHHVGNIVAKQYTIPANRNGALTSRGAITYQTTSGASMVFSIDAADYFGFEVEDIEAAQANPKYVAELTSRAGEALAQSVDRYLLGKAIAAATASADEFDQAGGGNIAINAATSGSAYDQLVATGVTLDDNLCPEDGRYVIWPTSMMANVLMDTRFVGAGADGSGKMRDKGYVGSIAGFEIYTLSRKTFQKYDEGQQSTQVLADSTTARHTPDVFTNPTDPDKDIYKGIASVKGSITYADQLTKTENIRLEGSFADAVRGLHVYGAKVLRPQWVVSHTITDTVATA